MLPLLPLGDGWDEGCQMATARVEQESEAYPADSVWGVSPGLRALGESPASAIDNLDKAERLGLIQSADN
jgi:hypothetical protein